MSNIKKTVPHQKIVEVSKEICNKENIYATINLEAMELAAQKLDAGAFKLWCYFAKNQNGYEFALSSKAAQDTFGIKIKQYNNAVDELIEKGFLVNTKGNNWIFNEKCVNTKKDNAVNTKSNNAVITKEDNSLLPKGIRNNTNNIQNNTKDNIGGIIEPAAQVIPLPTKEEAVGNITVAQLLRDGIEYDVVDESRSLIRVRATGKVVKVV